MNNIHQNSSDLKPILSIASIFSKGCLNLKALLSKAGFSKRSGASVNALFTTLFESILTGARTLHDRYSLSGVKEAQCSYSSLMRFASNCRYNWALLMLLMAKAAIRTCMQLNDEEHIYTFAVDDSIIERADSSKVEGLARLYDHVIHKTVKAFNNLLITWSDGFTTIPVSSQMVSSRNDKCIIREHNKKIDHRLAGAKRRENSKTRKPDLVVKLLRGILNCGIKASHILMDTWFYSDKLVAELNELGLESICMIKSNLKFAYTGEALAHTKTQKQLLKVSFKSSPLTESSDILSSVLVQTKSGQEVKLVFVRNRNNRKEFITLLSTDTTLSAQTIVELYSRRWSIECCFKTCKQFLGLDSECFAHDFDTITSLNSIAYMRFMVMELLRRNAEDERSHGQLFRDLCDEVRTIPFIEAIELLMQSFKNLVEELDKAGCIKDGMKEKALKIADSLVSKWYGQIAGFIKKLLSPNHLPHILSV